MTLASTAKTVRQVVTWIVKRLVNVAMFTMMIQTYIHLGPNDVRYTVGHDRDPSPLGLPPD